MPDSVPNYLSVDPDTGLVSASFSGGVVMPVDPNKGTWAGNTIQWVRTDTGALLAQIDNVGAATELELWTQDDGFGAHGPTTLTIGYTYGAAPNHGIAITVRDNTTGRQETRLLLGNDGKSMFVKSAAGFKEVIDYGPFVLNFGSIAPGGESSVTLNLGFTPSSANDVVIFGGLVGDTGAYEACTWGYTRNLINVSGQTTIFCRNAHPSVAAVPTLTCFARWTH